jgi:hypothetical protein
MLQSLTLKGKKPITDVLMARTFECCPIAESRELLKIDPK